MLLIKKNVSPQEPNRHGQGMTEYIIILALVAITSIAVIRIFGDSIKYQMADSISAFLGEGKTDVSKPTVTATSTKKRTMKDFARAND
jgi:Flp pilus assembly pilin Flp